MGPVDSFKAWASATMVAELARRGGDDELHVAASAALRHFRRGAAGEALVYTAGGPGTAGYMPDPAERRNVLEGSDARTLVLLQ